MVLRSGWLAPTGQTRLDTRHTALGATTPTGAFQSRSGILPGSDGKYRVGGLSMSSSGPMTATVFYGRAVIQGPASQGAYPVALASDTVITFADGDPLNPRIDLVVLRVYDDQFDGSTKSEAALEIIKGAPAATPVAPAAPALSLPLFHVKVPAGTSAGTGGIPWSTAGTLTDLRVTLVGVGGILPVYNNAAVPGSYPGQYQDNDNSHFLQRWDGTAWVAYPKEIGGIAPSGTVTTGSYNGQYRDYAGGTLQRWNGTAWVNYQPPVEVETTNTGATAATGWTLVGFAGRKTRGVCTVSMTVTRSGADLTATTAGNLSPDELLCTLPAGWRPSFDYEAMGTDFYGSGAVTFSTGGQVHLRTWSGSSGVLTAGRNLRATATFVQ
ncbi:hypothetical protein [Streptomyces sp. NBC_01353]|uniref:hypothetical protein n=1 Tax=Streptomyces sp. NBC_01353 TaxID=2903835 RepID=UPI002E31198A|nr:hypothetical protein [Streptomyces sp. NBC_01353]